MASTVGCLASSFPFKYLGLMVGANMNRINNWKSVYDVFDARLAKWKARLLSIGGRITLIKAVLESIPNYYFSLYKVPVQVVKDLEAKIRNFLWGGEDSVKKLHWVAWDRVSLPKKYGGLGLSKLKNTNIALLSKWGWRFLVDKNRLWSQTIEALHKVLNYTKVDGTPLRSFFKASVGNGRNTAFWLDPWVSNRPLKELFPRLFLLEMEKGCRVNSCFSENNHLIWRWKRPITSEEEVNELVNLCSMLVSVSLNQKQDSWLWNGAEDREFSVSAVKKLLDSIRIRSDIYVPEECNWIPKKCSIFIWKAEMGRIATMDELRRRNIGGGDAGCSLCGEADESIEHLFTNCYYALMLWAFLSSWCKSQNLLVFSFRDVIEAHNHVGLIGRKKEVFKGLIRIGCWVLWRMRNDVKFNNKSANVEAITREVKNLGFLWYNSRSKRESILWSEWCKFVNL
ncbi:putative reverse transcriptase zinc-binding domain-containing protein [Helianthus annuus]|nr:putative reverse transcriptase zinc-binding domain-containing protein [Helianthus annuus]KAJ0504082.1 putative reverse transcriptase zinc-binding domain-containing protein [Helianthus annuus]